jgi:hypothetical protein
VGSNKQDIAHFPVPIVDERTIVCPVNVRQDPKSELLIRRELWLSNLYESLRAQNQLFRELRDLVGKPDAPLASFEEAREKALKGITDLQNDIENLSQTRRSLNEKSQGQLDLKEGDQRLAELASAKKELDDFVARQQKAIDDVKKNAALGEQVRKVNEALAEEKQANFDRALQLYKEALAGGLADDKLKAHVEELDKTWSIKNEKHRAAREFIYKKWAQYDLRDMRAQIERARGAFQECRTVDDFLTPRKLLMVALDHAGELKKQELNLRPDEILEDQRTAQQVLDATKALGELMKDVSKYLEEKEKAKSS